MLDIGFGDGASLLRAAEGGAAARDRASGRTRPAWRRADALAAARVENCRVVRGDALELLAALAGDEGADDRRGSILAEWYDGLKIGEDPPPWYGSIDPNWDRLRYEDETGNLASDWDRAYFGEAPPSKVPLAVALAGANKRARAAAPPAGLPRSSSFPIRGRRPRTRTGGSSTRRCSRPARRGRGARRRRRRLDPHRPPCRATRRARARPSRRRARWREVAAPARPDARGAGARAGRLVTDVCFESPS